METQHKNTVVQYISFNNVLRAFIFGETSCVKAWKKILLSAALSRTFIVYKLFFAMFAQFCSQRLNQKGKFPVRLRLVCTCSLHFSLSPCLLADAQTWNALVASAINSSLGFCPVTINIQALRPTVIVV